MWIVAGVADRRRVLGSIWLLRARAFEHYHQSGSGDSNIEYRGRRRQQFQGIYLRESIVLYWRVKKLNLEVALDELTDCIESMEEHVSGSYGTRAAAHHTSYLDEEMMFLTNYGAVFPLGV
jgi:hypothetical protein